MLWEDMSLPAMKTGVFFAWACALRLDKEHVTSDSDPLCIVIGTKFFKKDPCWQWIVCTMKKGNDQYLWCWRKTFTPCAAKTIIFQRVNLNYIILCFTQCTLFLSIRLFSIAIFLLPCVICGTYVTRINAVSWYIGRHSRRLLIGLFNSLVYVHTYCLPIATLNQNKLSRLLYLGDAQIIKGLVLQNFNVVSVRDENENKWKKIVLSPDNLFPQKIKLLMLRAF